MLNYACRLAGSSRNAEFWTQKLNLERHPGGCGMFKELYRASTIISQEGYEGDRNASTSIVSLLKGSQISFLHKTKSDQTVHFYDGSCDLIVHYIDNNGKKYSKNIGLESDDPCVQFTVLSGYWFAFELSNKAPGSYVLTGHTVSPGFDFRDFELATLDLCDVYPEHINFIETFISPKHHEEAIVDSNESSNSSPLKM